MNFNNFKLFVLNLGKTNSDLICKTLQQYHYKCEYSDDIDYVYKYLQQESPNLLIVNGNHSNTEEMAILEQIRKISSVNIVFLTNEMDINKKNMFSKFNLLDYKVKLNNILTLIDEINILIKKLILNERENILIIKSKTRNRDKIEALLKLRHYNVIIASNGAQGWKEIKQLEKLSLIILDINLNDMNSLEILSIVKNKYNNEVPVIGVSVEYNPIILQQNILNGLSDLLNVPITQEEFNLKIDLWVDSVRQKREIKAQQLQTKKMLNSFKALYNATIEGLLMFEKSICVDANESALKLFEYSSKDDIIGKHILEIVPKDIGEYDVQQILNDKIDHEIEINMQKQDGTVFPTQIKERNIVLENRNLKILAILDLTDIKIKENMLHHQSKMASMGEMMGNIAHQWRQPLTAISIAASGMILNYELDIAEKDEIIEQLNSIVARTEFLSNTINDFQSFLKENKIKEHFKISFVVKKVLNLIGNSLVNKNITLIEQYNNDKEIYGLQNELVQAVLNIINNAKDAIVQNSKPQEQHLVSIESWIDKDIAHITIQDSAGGIPEQIIDKVFEPYFTTKHQSQGTGLGLYMTHQMIVEHMQGKLMVKNEQFTHQNKSYYGAKFHIQIPANLK